MNKSETATQAGHRLHHYVAKSVMDYRQKNILALAQFATKLGLSVKRIEAIENQRHDLRVTDIIKIAPAIEVQPSQLLRIMGL